MEGLLSTGPSLSSLSIASVASMTIHVAFVAYTAYKVNNNKIKVNDGPKLGC